MNVKTQKQKLSKIKTEKKKLTENQRTDEQFKQPNHAQLESLKEVKQKEVWKHFKEIMAKIFPHLRKTLNPQTQDF